MPSCSDIIGHYVIDRSKYPGANANWQYETYSFDITQSHIIVHDNRTTTAWKNQITWSDDQNYRWVFADVFFKQE
ncbi:MAG: hypothetical protein IZT59_08675 [Verrucomicrobia bacterium]|nr:hypothetical protein [Verrucomicrobiota bacterium]